MNRQVPFYVPRALTHRQLPLVDAPRLSRARTHTRETYVTCVRLCVCGPARRQRDEKEAVLIFTGFIESPSPYFPTGAPVSLTGRRVKGLESGYFP